MLFIFSMTWVTPLKLSGSGNDKLNLNLSSAYLPAVCYFFFFFNMCVSRLIYFCRNMRDRRTWICAYQSTFGTLFFFYIFFILYTVFVLIVAHCDHVQPSHSRNSGFLLKKSHLLESKLKRLIPELNRQRNRCFFVCLFLVTNRVFFRLFQHS